MQAQRNGSQAGCSPAREPRDVEIMIWQLDGVQQTPLIFGHSLGRELQRTIA
jgi:hypothetical protein